jgi:hypothetical protein
MERTAWYHWWSIDFANLMDGDPGRKAITVLSREASAWNPELAEYGRRAHRRRPHGATERKGQPCGNGYSSGERAH